MYEYTAACPRVTAVKRRQLKADASSSEQKCRVARCCQGSTCSYDMAKCLLCPRTSTTRLRVRRYCFTTTASHGRECSCPVCCGMLSTIGCEPLARRRVDMLCCAFSQGHLPQALLATRQYANTYRYAASNKTYWYKIYFKARDQNRRAKKRTTGHHA